MNFRQGLYIFAITFFIVELLFFTGYGILVLFDTPQHADAAVVQTASGTTVSFSSGVPSAAPQTQALAMKDYSEQIALANDNAFVQQYLKEAGRSALIVQDPDGAYTVFIDVSEGVIERVQPGAFAQETIVVDIPLDSFIDAAEHVETFEDALRLVNHVHMPIELYVQAIDVLSDAF